MRVREERNACVDTDSKKPHKDRYQGCEAFLNLSSSQKSMLVDRIVLIPNEFNIHQTESEIEKSKLLEICPPNIREKLSLKLIEWWDYQVLLQLRKKRGGIKKVDVQFKLMEIIQELEISEFTDSYSEKEPLNWQEELTVNIDAQLDLINGGEIRKKYAAINYWKARNQREEWLDEDLPLVNDKIRKFDKNLYEEWEYIFGTSIDGIDTSDEEKLKVCGRGVFDWSIKNAHELVQPISQKWQSKFLVRGSYQILSNDLIVGWHSDFKKKIS